MKKIVIISPAHPLRGGIAASSERLAQELIQEGHEVRIVSFSMQYPEFLFPGKTQFTTDPPPGLHIRPLIHSVNPLNWLRIGRVLAHERPDIVLVRYWLPFMAPCKGTILRLIRRNRHTKIVALVDNLVPHEHRPGDRLLTRWFTRSVDAFIAMSRSVESQLHDFEPNKPVVYIPHPLYDNYGRQASREESLARLGLPPAKGYLLFFGFIRDYKGLDLLLRAFALPVLAQHNLHLIVAGEFYGNEAKYRALISELGLEDRLTLHSDYIPAAEVRYYFGAADLVVQPYRTATQSGISQLAYHFEKPMVVSNVGGLPEIVEHGVSGYVVPVDEQAIAEAVADFFNNHQAEVMIPAVQEAKKRFSWSAMSAALLGIYQQLNEHGEKNKS